MLICYLHFSISRADSLFKDVYNRKVELTKTR